MALRGEGRSRCSGASSWSWHWSRWCCSSFACAAQTPSSGPKGGGPSCVIRSGTSRGATTVSTPGRAATSGGIEPSPPSWRTAMARVCDRCGALHIADTDEHGDHHTAQSHDANLTPRGAWLIRSHWRDDGQHVERHPRRTSARPPWLDASSRPALPWVKTGRMVNRVGGGWARARVGQGFTAGASRYRRRGPQA